MAAEYEIKEIGFIGSLWQGEFNSPLNVGKTIEVINVPNTVESGRHQSIFLSTNENVDIQKLNSQLPDIQNYYEMGKLNEKTLDELSLYTKIDKSFLSSLDVLYRYTRRNPFKDPNASSLPIQENWSFDTSDSNKVIYIYNQPQFIVFVNYVFLVSEEYQNTLSRYFLELQQGGNSINTPPSNLSVAIVRSSADSTVTYPQTPFFTGRLFGDVMLTDEMIEEAAVTKFTNNLSAFNQSQIEPVIDVTTGQPFSPEPLFESTDNTVISSNLKIIDDRLLRLSTFLEQQKVNPAFPFYTVSAIRTEIIYLNMIKNYLFERITQINNVGFPDEEPERYSISEEGVISVLPPPPIEDSNEVKVLQNDIQQQQDDFAYFIDDMIEELTIDDNNVYVFKKLSKVSDYDLPILRYKTKGLFRCTGEKLSTFYTGSLTEKQKKYYLTVFNEAENTTDSYHQFDITYCHISGSGSTHIENEVDLYPAKTMYRKYMLECFGYTNGKFPFKNGKNGDYFYAIQLDRTQYKEKLDAGNFELSLCELSSSGTQSHPTSTRFFTLIDESRDTKQEIVTNEGIQEYYYVTSGSLRDGVYNESTDDAWGIVFPKMGLIVLDGVVMDQSCSFNTITGSVDGQNSNRLFLSISGAAVPTSYRPSSSFFARSFETFLTETYFCRADFNEFNHSTNYTYVSGSDGFLKYDYFKKRPHSYITTIGLYNRNKELLAIGKLRNPILKNEGNSRIFEVVVRLN
jgi:hypothetical protein